MNTHPRLAPYFDEVERGNINAVRDGELVLFNYTDKCVFRRAWNHYTKAARGCIFVEETAAKVGMCMSKAFNLFECEETGIDQLPRLPFVVEEKVDGSLGTIFHYNGRWRTATRGAFNSEQAKVAAIMLKDKYDLSTLDTNITLACEIIYAANKICISYGERWELVPLAAFNREWETELPPEEVDALAERFGFTRPMVYDYALEDIIAMRDTLPKEQEGFIVRYANNYRIKIKGTEYLKMAKLISRLSPLAVWEVMEGDSIPEQFIMDYPEELRPELEEIAARLVARRQQIMTEMDEDASLLPERSGDDLSAYRKQLGLWLRANSGELRHPSVVFNRLLGNDAAVEKYIKEALRPTANVIGE